MQDAVSKQPPHPALWSTELGCPSLAQLRILAIVACVCFVSLRWPPCQDPLWSGQVLPLSACVDACGFVYMCAGQGHGCVPGGPGGGRHRGPQGRHWLAQRVHQREGRHHRRHRHHQGGWACECAAGGCRATASTAAYMYTHMCIWHGQMAGEGGACDLQAAHACMRACTCTPMRACVRCTSLHIHCCCTGEGGSTGHQCRGLCSGSL